MIHFNDDDTIEMSGTGGEILAEVGVISVNIIQQMIKCGMSKSNAITKFYEVIEDSIKVYEKEGEL